MIVQSLNSVELVEGMIRIPFGQLELWAPSLVSSHSPRMFSHTAVVEEPGQACYLHYYHIATASHTSGVVHLLRVHPALNKDAVFLNT
jgi:hypothetical protein